MHLEDVSRGATFADYDLDGDIDILVTNSNTPPRLLRNDGGNQNNWLQIKLKATNTSSDAIGTRVKITTGDLSQIREIQSGDGYLSQRELKLHFGLGNHKNVDKIEVRWVSGSVQIVENTPANQVLYIKENSPVSEIIHKEEVRDQNIAAIGELKVSEKGFNRVI